MQVKICGLTKTEQVKTCVKYQAIFAVFILNYPKSHRFISLERAKELTKIDRKEF